MAAASNSSKNSNGRKKPPRLDEIDLAILRELQTSSKITNANLAERVGISPPSTLERVRKLEAGGVITGYVALLDASTLNKSIHALIHVSLRDHAQKTLADAKVALSAIEEVLTCWHTAGDEDFMLHVVVNDVPHYEQFISETLSGVPGIGKLKTAFVLSTVKHTTQIPLDAVDAAVPRGDAGRRNGGRTSKA